MASRLRVLGTTLFLGALCSVCLLHEETLRWLAGPVISREPKQQSQVPQQGQLEQRLAESSEEDPSALAEPTESQSAPSTQSEIDIANSGIAVEHRAASRAEGAFDTPGSGNGGFDSWRSAFGTALVMKRVNEQPVLMDVDLSRCKWLRGEKNALPKARKLGKTNDPAWEVLSIEDSFPEIRKGISITRYGDGEWKLMMMSSGNINKGMEKSSKGLQTKLRQIAGLGGTILSGGLCVGMVPVYDKETIALMESKGRSFHETLGFAPHGWQDFFPSPGRYCSTSVTRPDHRKDLPLSYFVKQWRMVFDGKTVIFGGPTVTSKGGIAQLAPKGIFQCALSVTHVPLPKAQAFSTKEELLPRILQAWASLCKLGSQASKHSAGSACVVALVAGPAATVMAAELACLGIWAIDLGHMNPFENHEPGDSDAEACDKNAAPKISGPPPDWKDLSGR